ncbi:MAG: chromosome partitioning protein ParB, chromosome partitioning protein ParB family [Candidatus Parcubacteria bacterium]
MAFQGDAIFWVEVEKIVPNPFQPRREFDESKLKELSESIRMYGILQPLTVTRKEIQREDGAFYTQYELIAGERRLRASRLAGLEQVPVIIRSGENSEQEKLELAIIENLQREDLNAVDRALAFDQLARVFEMSHVNVAKKVGRSREYVSNTIRLLGLPGYMLDSLRTADISEGHARTLLMLNDKPEEQDVIFREILLKKLSVREVERIVRKVASDKVRKKNWVGTDAVLIEMEREFTDTLGTRVQISKTDFGGKLTIDYFSDEDLQKLLAIVKSQGKMTDFHLAGGESLEESSETVIQKLSEATALAPVAAVALTPTVPEVVVDSPMMTLEEALASEEAVSNELADTVVERVQSVAEEVVEQRQGLDYGEVSNVAKEMKVPHSSYVAQMSAPEEKYSFSPTPAPVPQEPVTEVPAAPLETQSPQVEKNDDDTDLYSMRNFTL